MCSTDAHKLAAMLRGGLFPMAYVYPKAERQTRDLLQRQDKKRGKRKVLSVLEAKIGRAVYW